jgi:hypothetical protein
MELDRIPLWRGDHVSVKQLAEDFARYVYLPRLKESDVLLDAIRNGVSLLTWQKEGFAFADSYDEDNKRYLGLRTGQLISLSDTSSTCLLVKGDVAKAQIDAETVVPSAPGIIIPLGPGVTPPGPGVIIPGVGPTPPPGPAMPRRFHGTVTLDTTRVGRDASVIAEEVIAHLAGLVGAKVTVTLEIEADIPNGVPDNVVRTVTENARTLKFSSQGFEKE